MGRPTFQMRALLAALVLVALSATAHATKEGDRASAFSLKDLNGRTVKLADLKGKVVVLDFWASWCEPCKKELPALDGVAKAKKDVVILAVNIDKERAKAEKFLKGAKVSAVRILLDPEGGVAGAYDLPTMPTSFVIDKKGIVRHVHAGYESGDEKRLAKELDALSSKQLKKKR